MAKSRESEPDRNFALWLGLVRVMNLHTLSLATITTLAGLLAPGARAAAPQQPPDPMLEVPAPRGWIPADPYESGTELGALHRPKGRIRKVTWYQAIPESARARVKCAWEKRIVQCFDDDGRCIEVERWCFGARVSWRTARSPGGTPREFEQTWGQPLFENPWREETVCDRSGAKIGSVRIPLALVGREVSDTMPWITTRWEYDEQGRCCRQTQYNEERWPRSIRRWHYDEHGRLRSVVDHIGSSQHAEEFEYDAEGRLTTRTSRGQDDRILLSSEFDYDALSRVSRTLERTDGAVTRSVAFAYGEDGELIRRQTRSFALGELVSREVEGLDGSDRPIDRELFDASDEIVGMLHWTYDNDSRGNWIRKSCRGSSDERDRDVRREIEYAD